MNSYAIQNHIVFDPLPWQNNKHPVCLHPFYSEITMSRRGSAYFSCKRTDIPRSNSSRWWKTYGNYRKQHGTPRCFRNNAPDELAVLPDSINWDKRIQSKLALLLPLDLPFWYLLRSSRTRRLSSLNRSTWKCRKRFLLWLSGFGKIL